MTITLTPRQTIQREIDRMEDQIDREQQLRSPDRHKIVNLFEDINILEHALGGMTAD